MVDHWSRTLKISLLLQCFWIYVVLWAVKSSFVVTWQTEIRGPLIINYSPSFFEVHRENSDRDSGRHEDNPRCMWNPQLIAHKNTVFFNYNLNVSMLFKSEAKPAIIQIRIVNLAGDYKQTFWYKREKPLVLSLCE